MESVLCEGFYVKPILIFGTGEIAEVAAYYFEKTLGRQVAGFTVDSDFIREESFQGRPVIAFQNVAETFPPSVHDGFVALSYARMNVVRATKVDAMRQVGYSLTSYISPHANVFTDDIGENCFILEDNTIQPFSRIGDNVTLWSGNHIGHHSVIEENVFISSHVVVSGGVTVGHNSFLGVNSTISDHVSVAPFSLIGAGVPIGENTDAEGIYALPFKAEKRSVPSTRLKKF